MLHDDAILSLCFSRDSAMLASASQVCTTTPPLTSNGYCAVMIVPRVCALL